MPEAPLSPDALIQALPSALLYVENDAHYTLRFANKQAALLLGYDIEDFLGSDKYTAASVVHPDDLDLLEHADGLVAEGTRPVIVRYRLIDSQGNALPVLDVSRPVVDEKGGISGFVTLLVDLRGTPDLQGPSKILSSAS